MKTYETIEAARAAAAEDKSITTAEIAEIVTTDHTTVYIRATIPVAALVKVITPNPLPGVLRVVRGHDVLSPEARAEQDARDAAARRDYLATKCNCDRCKCHVDGNTAYKQLEWYRGSKVNVYYCATCAATLRSCGAGELDDLQARAAARPSRERETKTDE